MTSPSLRASLRVRSIWGELVGQLHDLQFAERGLGFVGESPVAPLVGSA